jgi:hypothetical protein
MRQDKISLPLLIALHLVPGFIFAGFFFVLSRIFIQQGFTGYLALLIAIPACLAPMELGVMLYWSARTTGRRSLSGAIVYRSPGTALDYTVLPLLLFLCGGVLLIAVNPISQYLDAHLTVWLPAWTSQAALITDLANSSPTQQTIALGLGVLLSGFLAPLVEELYFRGFLLPRMEHLGWVAPLLNAFLFAIYHFYFPGNVPGIFLVFLPIAYVVMLKKNWRIGAVTHSFINLWGVFSLARLIS